jgi:S-DNA-T family DNA segregation ATPase FtsK/SpoIIIE
MTTPSVVVVVGVFIAGMVLWRHRSPQTFERWITSPVRARYLAWYRYRRRWTRLMTAAHLTLTTADGTIGVPRLLSVRIGETTDRVRVRMLEGHCPADYENRTTHLAGTFGAHRCDAAIVGPGTVEIVLYQQLSPTAAALLDDLRDVA